MKINSLWLRWPVREFGDQVVRSLEGFHALDWLRLHERLVNDKYLVYEAIESELRRRVRQAHAKEKRDA